MTNTQSLSRAEAEAAARAGAKVRHERWKPGVWVTIEDGQTLWDHGLKVAASFFCLGPASGWSIITPAPDAGQPDTANLMTGQNIPLSVLPEGALYRDSKTGVPTQQGKTQDFWGVVTVISDKTDWQANTGETPEGPVDVAMNNGSVYQRCDPETDCNWTVDSSDYRIAFWRHSGTANGDGDLRQATELAKAIHARHWSGEAEWRPAPTLSEVLLQIDNMTAGLVRAASPAFTTTRKPRPDGVSREVAYYGMPRNFIPDNGPRTRPSWPVPATNPHPEGSRKWAKFEMKRGRKVRRPDWDESGWLRWHCKGLVQNSKGKFVPWENWSGFSDFQLVGDDQ